MPHCPQNACLCSAGSERPLVCAADVDFFFFYFFLFFLKSRLLLQVLTQENLATVLTGVVVPAGAVTQPLLIPISIAGQVSGQQGLAVWTIPTAAVAALPGLAAASPTGAVFKPPLAGLQGNGSSPRTAPGPHHPTLPPLHQYLPCWTQNLQPTRGHSPGFWIQCHKHPATEPLHLLGTLGQDTRLASRPAFLRAAARDCPPPPTSIHPMTSQKETARRVDVCFLEPTCLLPAQGRGEDERCWRVPALQASRESQLPHAHCPQCPAIFVPDPLGLEPCRVVARRLSHLCLCLAP